MTLIERDQQYIAPTYARFPLAITHGKGSTVYDEEGNAYTDLTTGIGVSAFGVADDAWIAAVTAQLSRVQHMSNLYYTSPCGELAELLCKKTGMSRVFFANSGAEANECAIKVARKWAAENKGPEYSTIITLENSFHGRTLTTLAATGQAHYHELFQPLTGGFVHTPANDFEALIAAARSHKCAAILVECVQGEGGVIPMEKEFLEKVASFAEKENILLMVDEVQTGNGRTGTLYAYMQYGIRPDVVSTAKGLGGGLPLGAALLSRKVATVLGHGDHGSTFGGNPVACAGAVSVISRIDDALLADVREKSEAVFALCQGAKGVKSVSGLGLMIGIETEKPAAEIVKKAISRGVLALTAKNKVRLLPALNIPKNQLLDAVRVILDICAED